MIDSGATHNFITEAEARRLRLRWEKDSGRMKAMNSVALPLVKLVKQTVIRQESRPSGTTIHSDPAWGVGKTGETIPKDTLCVPEKCHGLMPNSLPKSLSMRRRTDHGIEPLSEAKAHAKNVYRTMPSELAVL
ncbi:RNA-directed DNA polymerase-like protein [Cucumis melo var. makuwa]|uniref:RNA-directed DNA polymerase-like protein n=1 Tax=Cucumis melo var. makuwa TaxID=1194695 RepID=A0A5D3CQR5_CUCMM|nr:RNA-directed DNA polymerase-like protein [Cucumis melo var. makuwa]